MFSPVVNNLLIFCAELYFSQFVAATLVFFDHSGDIIHINIKTSVVVEPTNVACAPSTATSEVLNHYTTEASSKKDAQVAYITTPALQYTPYRGSILTGRIMITLSICSSDICQKDKCRCYRLREIS